jgi:hypothetical protein
MHRPRREQAQMNDHTRQNLGRMNAHTCSTLVGTLAFAQPPRALAQRSVKSTARPRPRPCPLALIKPSQARLTSPRAHLRWPNAPP